MLTLAIEIANFAHMEQVDKSGQPYILHPLRVMTDFTLTLEKERIVAVLHDVVEDTTITLEEIRERFGDEIADAVDSVSKREGELYKNFVMRAAENPIGIKVKYADLKDNMRPERQTDPAKFKSLMNRYEWAVRYLESKLP